MNLKTVDETDSSWAIAICQVDGLVWATSSPPIQRQRALGFGTDDDLDAGLGEAGGEQDYVGVVGRAGHVIE
jgi:hypothetical protein